MSPTSGNKPTILGWNEIEALKLIRSLTEETVRRINASGDGNTRYVLREQVKSLGDLAGRDPKTKAVLANAQEFIELLHKLELCEELIERSFQAVYDQALKYSE